MCKIVNGPRTAAEIAEELARRGWRILADHENRRWELIPPEGATAEEIDAASAFLLELMNRAAAAYGGKVTICQDDT